MRMQWSNWGGEVLDDDNSSAETYGMMIVMIVVVVVVMIWNEQSICRQFETP